MPENFDYLVIGGGSGGIASAVRAASYGARVAVVEHGRLGGTCVNVGCVPKKVMWFAAHMAQILSDAPDYGFDLDASLLVSPNGAEGRSRHDWGALVRSRDDYVRRLNGIYERRLDTSGIALYSGSARFTGPREVEVDGKQLRGEHVLVATGGVPTVPDVEGAGYGITSDGFFELDSLPASVAVIGSGYIAVELAGMLQALGSRVEIFARGERVLRHFDPILGETLMEAMASGGPTVRPHSHVQRVERMTSGGRAAHRVHLAEGAVAGPFEQVLWAVGRSPNTASLGLDVAGVALATDGSIGVDDFQCTTAEQVYAVGDVIGRYELTPVAIAAGRRLSDRLFDAQGERRLVYECIASAIFTHPPIGTVGLSEPEARARHGDDAVNVYQTRFTPMYNAFTRHKEPTAMKLVTVGSDERVVGCHIIGAGADEMLQGFAVAVRMGATKRDLDDTVAIHPTSAEELVTMT